MDEFFPLLKDFVDANVPGVRGDVPVQRKTRVVGSAGCCEHAPETVETMNPRPREMAHFGHFLVSDERV
eukprot:5941332-Pyramimonas_sp.AAC.1